MNPPDGVQPPLAGTGTSAEGHEAAQRGLGGQSGAFPAMWWSPSDEQWYAEVPGEGLMAFGALGSREDSLPKDAQRLVPVGPLRELAERWTTARNAHLTRALTIKEDDEVCDEDDEVLAQEFGARATELHKLLASLLGESPEATTTTLE